MSSKDDTLRVLMDSGTANRLAGEFSRRQMFGIAGGSVALAAFLAACGNDKATSGSKNAGGDGGSSNSFKLFTWAEYDDPELMKKFGNIEITIFNSNEEAIQKLVSAKGNAGFDMVCPTGVYIPQMVKEGLLQELDFTRIPNFKNLDPAYANQPWDPGNKHSVCKNWGSTGWIYDKSVVTREIKTWADFIDVAMNEASGKTSILDTAPNLCGVYFWANGIDWNTTKKDDLDACESFLVDKFASHIKAFDAYPGINLTQGNYALSQVWNGDARQGLNAVVAAGDDPKNYGYQAVGAPETELWMDNWCILAGAANTNACYAFIDFILDPANSAQDIKFHGYNTAVLGSKDALPADTPYLDMVYFTPEEVSRMRSGSLDNQDRVVDIYNKVKAAAGG